MGYYEKAVGKDAYQRYLDKNDDEYWNDYVNVRTGESVGNLEEALKMQNDPYRISVSKTENNRVQIELSREQALNLYESLGLKTMRELDSYGVPATLRRLLKDYFILNEDVAEEGYCY